MIAPGGRLPTRPIFHAAVLPWGWIGTSDSLMPVDEQIVKQARMLASRPTLLEHPGTSRWLRRDEVAKGLDGLLAGWLTLANTPMAEGELALKAP